MDIKKHEILRTIKSPKSPYTPQQANIASYVLDNYQRIAFLTATQLAKEIGVSQATVIRFAQMLGFQKYNLFQEVFQELLNAELTSTDRFNLSLLDKNTASTGISSILFREIRTLTAFTRTFPQESFDRVVSMIARSGKLYVIGTRGSASLAQYFTYFINKVKRNVIPMTAGSTSDYDKILNFEDNDMVVAIAFPRYPRETLEMVQFCRDRDWTIAGITDKIGSPLYRFSNTTIIVPVTFSTIFDSYCSAFCLFNMIVTEVARANREESAALTRDFEVMARELGTFIQERRTNHA